MKNGRATARRLGVSFTWLPCLAGPLAVAFVVGSLFRFSAAVMWNSDAASPSLLVESLGGGNNGQTVLGDISSLADLLGFMATRWIPDHRAVWDVLPYATALGGILLLAAAVRRLAGNRAAALTFSLATAVSVPILFAQVAPAFHGTTWTLACVLAFALVWLQGRDGQVAKPKLFAGAVGLGVIAGIGLASDPLLLIVGIVPFVIATLLSLRWRREGLDRRQGIAGLVTGVVSIAVAVTASQVASGFGLVTSRGYRGANPLALASLNEIVTHFAQLWRNLLTLIGVANGSSVPTHWYGYPTIAVALAALGSLLLALVQILRRNPSHPRAEQGFLVFWASSIVLLIAGYVVSAIPNAEIDGPQNARYLVPLCLAVSATLPILWRGQAFTQLATAAAAAVLIVPGFISVVTAEMATGRERGPIARQAPAVEAWLTEQQATVGYGGYWDAASLTFQTGLVVRAVEPCEPDLRATLFPRIINTRRGWYRPTGARRSFLLVNTQPSSGITRADARAAGDLGPPAVVRTFGTMSALIYDYDLGQRLGGPWGIRHG